MSTNLRLFFCSAYRVIKRKEYCMMKQLIKENDMIVNLYASNTEVPKSIKLILIDIKGEIDNNTITVGHHTNQSIDHEERKSISKQWA